VLPADPEGLPARDEDLQVRAIGEELQEDWCRDRDLLEVVEDQQHALRAEASAELVQRRPVHRLGQPDRRRGEGQDGVGVGRGDEVDEVDTVRESVDLVGCGPDRQPRLAGPAGAGQREQPDVGVVEALADRLQLGFPAHEGGRLGRQVVGSKVERRQRRELGRQRRMADLVQAFRAAQVLQPVLAEVAQPDAVRKVPVDHLRGRLGQQDLAAVTCRHDPRRSVDGRAEVVPAARLGLAGVDPHPDADHAELRPRLMEQGPLRSDSGPQRVGRDIEDRHQSVAGGLDDGAGGLADRGAEDRVVAGQGRPHRLRGLLPHARAALDVREQEREERLGRDRRRTVDRLPGFRAPCRNGHAVAVLLPPRSALIIARAAISRRNGTRPAMGNRRMSGDC
jgi:hypothetical protein